MSGPLAGLRVLELPAIGPVPHAGLVLADLGADVVRIARPGGALELTGGGPDYLLRGRRTVTADLKQADGLAQVRALIDRADVLLEGMRPGVTERLGVGPEQCLASNPRLIYARMTGWGRTGPLADRAGHDLNYLAATGLLATIGDADGPPVPPLNLLGDFAGGSMVLLTGILAALWQRERSGRGQVVDTAIVTGAGLVGQMVWALSAVGQWQPRRGSNLLDGGAPFYTVYRCADGGFVAVGPLEDKFYAEFLAGLDLDPATVADRTDRSNWPALRELFGGILATRTRDEWAAHFAGTDACVSPVLDISEATRFPQLAGGFVTVDGAVLPAPAPGFSATPTVPAGPPPTTPVSAHDILADWTATDRTETA